MRNSLYLRFFPKSGIDVNSNISSNDSVVDMFDEWTKDGAKELQVVVKGVVYNFKRKKK